MKAQISKVHTIYFKRLSVMYLLAPFKIDQSKMELGIRAVIANQQENFEFK